MKIILFSGFLGAGKTMAILSLAKYLLRGVRPGKNRLVLIENEVGQTGIDDKLLGAEGYTVETLLSGCICCTLSTSLTQTLNEIHREYDPDYVVFEPTGVAFPEKIAGTLHAWGEAVEWIHQVTLVDAKRWKKIRCVTPALSEAQVSGAGLILLNKCDLAEKDLLETLEAELREINPGAPIVRTIAIEGIPDRVWKEVAQDG